MSVARSGERRARYFTPCIFFWPGFAITLKLGDSLRKSQDKLVETAKRHDLPVKRLNPDGSVDVGEAETTGNGHDKNEWDEWEANRHATD